MFIISCNLYIIYLVLNVKIMFWMKYMKLCLEPYLSIIPGIISCNLKISAQWFFFFIKICPIYIIRINWLREIFHRKTREKYWTTYCHAAAIYIWNKAVISNTKKIFSVTAAILNGGLGCQTQFKRDHLSEVWFNIGSVVTEDKI